MGEREGERDGEREPLTTARARAHHLVSFIRPLAQHCSYCTYIIIIMSVHGHVHVGAHEVVWEYT